MAQEIDRLLSETTFSWINGEVELAQTFTFFAELKLVLLHVN